MVLPYFENTIVDIPCKRNQEHYDKASKLPAAITNRAGAAFKD